MAKGPFFRGLGCLAARRFPAAACPRPANLSGRASYWARTATPQPPSLRLRGTAADAASDRLGLPRPGQALALSHFSNASRSAPHWTGRDQDKRGFGDGDKECEKYFSPAITGTCPGRGAAFFMPLRRTGTLPSTGVWYGPGSAKQASRSATYCIAPRDMSYECSHRPISAIRHHDRAGDVSREIGGEEDRGADDVLRACRRGRAACAP